MDSHMGMHRYLLLPRPAPSVPLRRYYCTCVCGVKKKKQRPRPSMFIGIHPTVPVSTWPMLPRNCVLTCDSHYTPNTPTAEARHGHLLASI